jgi:hypothetical protein
MPTPEGDDSGVKITQKVRHRELEMLSSRPPNSHLSIPPPE